MPALFVEAKETLLSHRSSKIWFRFDQDFFLTNRGINQHISPERLCDLHLSFD